MAETAQQEQKKNVSAAFRKLLTTPGSQLTANTQFRSFIWDSDTHLKTLEERKLLRKLDFSILTIGCVGFFVSFSR